MKNLRTRIFKWHEFTVKLEAGCYFVNLGYVSAEACDPNSIRIWVFQEKKGHEDVVIGNVIRIDALDKKGLLWKILNNSRDKLREFEY